MEFDALMNPNSLFWLFLDSSIVATSQNRRDPFLKRWLAHILLSLGGGLISVPWLTNYALLANLAGFIVAFYPSQLAVLILLRRTFSMALAVDGLSQFPETTQILLGFIGTSGGGIAYRALADKWHFTTDNWIYFAATINYVIMIRFYSIEREMALQLSLGMAFVAYVGVQLFGYFQPKPRVLVEEKKVKEPKKSKGKSKQL